MKKKLLAWALLLCMLATLLPVSAFAEGELADAPAEDAAPIGGGAEQSEAEGETDGEEPPQSEDAVPAEDAAPASEDAGQSEAEGETDGEEPPQSADAAPAEDASPVGGGAEQSEAEGETDGEEPPQSADADSSPEGGAEEVAEETLSLETEIEEEVSEELDAELADESETGGVCALNTFWHFSNGVLTISGDGRVNDYTLQNEYSYPQWYGIREQINKIIISEGITAIGCNAFYNCSYATEVSIAGSVLSIDFGAFDGCNSLNDVYYAKSEEVRRYRFTKTSGNDSLFNATWYYGESTVASGDCGANSTNHLNWTLDSSGVLIISGTGGMNNFTYDFHAPWYDYRNRIKEVILTSGVPEIGSFAFNNCTELETVSIPESVTGIGGSSFYNCTKLKEVVLPTNLINIGSWAFCGCQSITEIVIPSNVTIILESAFSDCLLSSITFEGSMPDIESNAFYNVNATAYFPINNKTYNADTMQSYGGTIDWKGKCKTHVPDESIIENIVTASCASEGSYDAVVYCSVCGEELSRETKTVDKLPHTPGEAVHENEVASTCSAAGSYDEVVYCTVCDEEISRETKTVEKLPHTPGEAVRENEVAPTVEKDGGYDMVVYCSACGEELAITHVIVPRLAPTITTQPKAAKLAVGKTASFSVAASGTGLSYQWYVQKPGGSWTKISGATKAGYSVAVKLADNGNKYRCTVTNPGGSVNSSAVTLTVFQTGWVKADGKWTYYNSSGTMVKGWQKISGKWYYFNTSGVMQTGWQKISNKWYYFNSSGAMLTGWQKISNKWYYFNSSGAMLTGWQKISNKWYYFNSSGAMLTGWQKISSKWYYFESGGAMKTGWLKLSGKWYYFESSGAMVTGSKKIGSKTYNFNSSGVCQNP